VRIGAILLVTLLLGPVRADDTIRVAVASNFADTAAALGLAFESNDESRVSLSSGSTGKLYAQIVNGAPFDVFLAADAERPRLLEDSGNAVLGSRFTYAIGALVVWSPTATDCIAALHDAHAGRIAIANPATAPYGRAARDFLVGIDAWDGAEPRVVYGQNVLQALQFAATGNVSLAIIPRTHAWRASMPPASCIAEVPAAAHSPLVQQAVLINADSGGARRFFEFLQSNTARRMIERSGYGVAP
jgi:molybdate transport system substrate-binding protein